MTVEDRKRTDDMIQMIADAPTAWHATANRVARFEAEGYRYYTPGEALQPGDRIYSTVNDSAFFAFAIGDEPLVEGFRLVGSHTDSPALKLKPKSLRVSQGAYVLSAEIYGGPIMASFFDTPLSVAGRIWLKTEDPMAPEMQRVDLSGLKIILPSLAIHLNRDVNNGVKIEPQKVMLPVLGLEGEAIDGEDDPIAYLLRKYADVDSEREILSFELLTYDPTPAAYVGADEVLINCPRLDNLAMVHASTEALLEASASRGIAGVLCTDNEEIGSRTPQGAASMYIRDLLTSIVTGLGGRPDELGAVLGRSFMISADLAHAVHPNYAEMYDPDNRPMIGKGPVIKHASGSYATDSRSAAVFRALCAAADVPCQDFTNRTDLRGGSTIGPITSVNIPMPTVDVGNAIWGMHSLRETGAVADQEAMTKVMRAFFER